MTESSNYKIRFKIGEYEFEVVGDKDFVDKKYEDFKSIINQKPSILPATKTAAETASTKKMSVTKRDETITEYLKRLKPKSNTEKAIAIARWHELLDSNEDAVINTTDLINAIKRDKPNNPSDVLYQCTRNGWLKEEGEKDGLKAYRLTKTGLEKLKELEKV
ncbi:MAG: hypothetical protein ACTSYH_06020 [Candidatus Heimdallarchaeaceae archaeon]